MTWKIFVTVLVHGGNRYFYSFCVGNNETLADYHSFIFQGLSLVDWGRGIDLSLFPDQTEFIGDSRTSGFRCIQMQEQKPWKYQVNAFQDLATL